MDIQTRSTGVFFTWIIVSVVWIYLSSATKDQIKDNFDSKSVFKQELQKRAVEWNGCFLPLPLENGKFYPSSRRCPQNDTTAACRMVPGTPVPYNWVIYFYCHTGYMLNTSKPVSVCLNGRWRPLLPVCKEGAAECTDHEDCPENRACIVGLCADSCDGLCGPNSVCDIAAHRPQCTCKKGYVGNPFKGCIKGGPVSVKILLAHLFEVSVVDPNLDEDRLQSAITYPTKIYLDPNNRWTSVAYHYDKKYLYFTGPDEIYRDKITDQVTRTGPPEIVVQSTGDFSAKLAVDWIHDKLFWMSHSNNSIEASDLDGRNRKTLVSGLSPFYMYSNNFAVDPFAAYLFVVNHDNITRFNLDGSNMIILDQGVKNSRRADVLTLDTRKRRIYYSSGDIGFNGWTGAYYIGSCDYEGQNRNDHHLPYKWTDKITSMDFFQNTLYFGDNQNLHPQYDRLWKSDLTIPDHPTQTDPLHVQMFFKQHFYYVKVFHPEAQKEAP